MNKPSLNKPEPDLELQILQDTPREHIAQGVPSIRRLGLEVLEPSYALADLLRSAGIDDVSVTTHAAVLRKRYLSPFSWSTRRKVLALTCCYYGAMLSSYAAGAYSMAAEPLQEEWKITATEFNVGLTLFVSGFGFAPMVLAPVSETFGRYWVYVGSGIVFFLGTVGCAVTDSYAGMMISRLVVGTGAAVFVTITGGVVSDLFRKENRNTPMALYALIILIGTSLGPMISGFIVDRLGWRWIFYLQLITIGTATLLVSCLFDETRSSVTLHRMCTALNKLTNEHPRAKQARVRFKSPESRKVDPGIVWKSFAFPLRLLITEPVVIVFSLWVAFAWAILYMQFSSIGILFRQVYDFDSTQVGAVYTSAIVASILSFVIAVVQDPMLRKIWPERMDTPEGRLVSPGVQSILLPIGLFWFYWSARSSVHWISPTLAIGSCTMGIFSIYLAVFNYLADTYGAYASSAQAAQSMCRNLLAGVFPLVTHIILSNLGYGGAGSLLGGIGLLLTAIPWILTFYGQSIRARSPFSKKVMADSG